MPVGKVFVDTNVLLYAHDRGDTGKAAQATAWLQALTAQQVARINLQVLNELAYVLLRKKWFDTTATAYAVVDEFSALGDTSITSVEVVRARRIHETTGYSWWDCLLLASALELGCRHFLSEDLQDGQLIEGLTIVDPFAHSPDQIPISR